MFQQLSSSERILAIQRLTALWALNECGLGGILHAFQSPFTGLLVGSIAMICIAMICSLASNKWKAVMSSLIVVLIIKALVSPYTTPTAYIAVTFQAVTGALIYRSLPGLLIGSILFATLGLMESALQRLLVLTILYGNNLWEAIDTWGAWVSERWGVVLPVSSSSLLIYTYLAIHFIAGVFVGWLMYKIITGINYQWGKTQYQLQLRDDDRREFFNRRKKSSWKRFVIPGVLLVMILFSYSITGSAGLTKGLLLFLRVSIILVMWFVFVAPFIMKVVQKFLNKKHSGLSLQVAQTLDMLPYLAWIIERSWNESTGLPLVQRWKMFAMNSILYILQFRTKHDTDPHRPYA